MTRHPTARLWAAFVGLSTGLAISNASGERALMRAVPGVAALSPSLPGDPVPRFTNARMAVAVEAAREHLDANRPWAAWKELRGFVKDPSEAPDAVVLMAARAAAGWDGWAQVRRLLEGQTWLEERSGGEGLFLLARAEEARGDWSRAADGYRRYRAVRNAPREAEASARMGRALSRKKDPRAADAFGDAAGELGAQGDWMRVLQAEALARAGDPRTPGIADAPSTSAAVRVRLARADAGYRLAKGDTVFALQRLTREESLLRSAGADPHAAELALERVRILVNTRRPDEARQVLRGLCADTSVPAALRLRAATRLGEVADGGTADEQMARAAAYEAANRPGLAARSLRAAIRAGASSDPAQRLRLGRLLYEERDFRPAREVLAGLGADLSDPAQAAEAELYAARALSRVDAGAGLAELRKLAERRPGTAAAGTALFLLGDAAGDVETGIAYYRRAADIPASPDAREALMRLGDRRQKAGDPTGATAAWESYVARYPSGETTAELAYKVGVQHERAGRADRARSMYGAAILADPVSYFAIRAGDRSGADPLARALANNRAWPATPRDAGDAKEALGRLEVLDRLGLQTEWKEELDWQTVRLTPRPAALLALAEGLTTSGHPVEGIRLGRALLERRNGEWDARLLRVVFPFPFRDVLTAEADRADVDPYLLAGLVRQESSFRPDAKSWVGATGLSQIMPATGAWLAPNAGVSNFDASLLAVPEINLRMGARYLGDQLERYRGKRDLALAAYNAGPSRADRWRRELGYGADVDAFRERIPFAETREYVHVVLRNAAVYRRLYGGSRSPGLAGDR
ncbi:transglycosylase SLT domain-containing protein [Longimicrobium terrae]|uniref:Soluble lytic murein transglycosylase n=1 Tax=Longimicrobium terrae TaxID=1639882 RepID=A0A841GY60_9BACT|nr:transglycosylase SLT domain-containing protein [Longimicrobium terrae]MBB4636280.1 soluble lytic murein transglycosylase [Longimicrobium terrae]MBB6070676.1 soluble lytic murein transglycosylase [Longimicrobium terrae]NNC29658.1 transglycosylase SLT domain-containing protein [Longimicrobium terrae]